MSSSLPKIAVIFCGGTIAAQAKSNLELTSYDPRYPGTLPKLRPQELLDKVPELGKVVQIVRTEELVLGYRTDVILRLASTIQSLDREIGVVVVQGTNIISETAFLLDLVLDRPGPIVVTGSMRPISALSSDGPHNLIQACSLAGTECARNRGVMVCLNDRITSGYYCSKISANRMDTFGTFEQGQLGIMRNYSPHFFYEPAKPTGKPFFGEILAHDGTFKLLPKVGMVYCYVDIEEDYLEKLAADEEVQGIVMAGFGCAGMPHEWHYDTIPRLIKEKQLPIVFTSIHAHSHVPRCRGIMDPIAAGDLGPAKAQILLQLCLASCGNDLNSIRRIFGTEDDVSAVMT